MNQSTKAVCILITVVGTTVGATAGDVLVDGAIAAGGIITSESGGFQFPDATIQTSASPPEHVRIVVVSPVGNQSENGIALLDALSSISPDVANPFLLKIEPGIYDVGASQFQTKQYLDVEGSGQGVTKIRGNYVRAGALPGLVQVVSNSELRMLTVENYGGDPSKSYSGIDVWNEVNARIADVTVLVHSGNHHWGVESGGEGTVIRDVTIRCTGGSENIGVNLRANNIIVDNVNVRAVDGSYANFGVFMDSILDKTIMNSVIEVSGAASTDNTGLYNQGGSHPDIFNSVIRAFGATNNYAIRNSAGTGFGDGGDIEIHNSRISGEDNSIFNEASYSVYVGSSQLKGPVSNTGSGSIKCANSCDMSFNELNSSCS